jgi:hypothetical protein
MNNNKKDTKLVSKSEKSSQNCIGMHMNMSFQCYLQELVSMQGKILGEHYLISRGVSFSTTSISTNRGVTNRLFKIKVVNAYECCKHCTWSHHFELQTNYAKITYDKPHCEKKTFFNLDSNICTNI